MASCDIQKFTWSRAAPHFAGLYQTFRVQKSVSQINLQQQNCTQL